MEDKTIYYVYEHRKKGTDEVFYIGIGKMQNGKYARAMSRIKRNAHWHAVANKYDYEWSIVLETEDREEACQKEIELILKYGRRDLGTGTLTNMTTGGEKSFYMSSESVKRNIQTKRENGAMEKIRESARGRMLTSNPWKGKTHDGFNKKKIYQYDAYSGKLIKEWKSIRFATRELKCANNSIAWGLIGRRKFPLGSFWSYDDLGPQIDPPLKEWKNGFPKHVVELSKDGNIINIWESVTKASEDFSCSLWMLSYHIKRGNTVDGRIVRFK
jgi:hypothetical protein